LVSFYAIVLAAPIDQIEVSMPVSKNRHKTNKKSSAVVKKIADTAPTVTPPSRKALEKMMAELNRGLTVAEFSSDDLFDDGGDDDPLWQAQNIMYDAWEAPAKRERIALARRALKVSEQCADAYVLLANEAAKNIIETRTYLEQAVVAGEQAVGAEAFEHDVGHFWGLLETRPYMRARADLAQCLWELGERENAAQHMLDLLRLNPNDNQGVRYILMSWLLALDDREGLEKILEEYPEASAWASYSQALLLFKCHGPAPEATKALKTAAETNAHVVDYLLRTKKTPATLPEYYSPGSKEEAVFYINDNRENWATAKGALQWLAQTIQK
jgi:tetratricopeptide (TPR) repeat protein